MQRFIGPTLPWRALLLVLIVAVSVLALTPAPADDLSLGWDKLNHLAAFSALALCGALGWRAPRARQLLVLAMLLAYGALIELLQQHVPNRTGEWGDLLADALGIGIGACVAVWLLRARPARAVPLR